jgi:predicted component of type VI protein secretion system
MKLSLVVLVAGKQEGKVLEIKTPQFVVGRDPECHLRPASPMISKRHCALIQKEGKVYIKDFGSTNGSFVNDQPVQNAVVQLNNGDRLKIGPLLFEVRLEVEADAPTDQKTPAPKQAAVSQPTPAPRQAAVSQPTPAPKEAAVSQPAPTRKPIPAPAKPAKAPVKAAQPPAKQAQPATMKAEVATPASGPPSRPFSSGSNDDDDIAAMLLSGTEDETVNDGPAAVDIPQGTTVFELPIPDQKTGEQPKVDEQGNPVENKDKPKDPPKKENESNSAVAAAILEKLRKRPRN